jgi:hypothetical protein
MKQMLMFAGAAALAFSGTAIAKPGHGHGNPHAYGLQGYGAGGCPPGLAKKAVPCMPPGQAKKIYGVGQRLPSGMFSPYAYNRIPYDIRTQYGLSPYGNYYYGDGYLYRVDPRTMLIQQVISALLYR